MSVEPSLATADPAFTEAQRCERLAEHIRNIEMPDTRKRFINPLVQTLLGQEVTGEHALRALLYVGTTWETHLEKCCHLPHLHRTMCRQSVGVRIKPELVQVLDQARQHDLEAIRKALRVSVDSHQFPRHEMLMVLPFEAACLRERTSNLAENADPYSMRTMARLLPRLRIYDELADRLDLLYQQSVQNVSQEPDLGLFRFLGDKEYSRFCQVIESIPGAESLPRLWNQQRTLQLEPNEISSLFTIAKSLQWPHPQASWMEILTALFAVATDRKTPWILPTVPTSSVKKPLEKAGVVVQGGKTLVSLGQMDATQLLDTHALSRDLTGNKIEHAPDWKSLVLSNITRETLLIGFLNNPKCTKVPGLVECMVVNSRSAQILSMIATKRDLHTGHQNKGVPAALLGSRMKIPMNLLRRFIHLRFVSKAELKDLAHRAPRPEVAKEVAQYLATI